MSESIKKLVRDEVLAKRAFQEAQKAVREEINKAFQSGYVGTIETGEEIGGVKIAIRVEKKGDGEQYCSWTKVKLKPSVALGS